MNITFEVEKDFTSDWREDNGKEYPFTEVVGELNYDEYGFFRITGRIYSEGDYVIEYPSTQIDVGYLYYLPSNWFRKKLSNDPLANRNNFPGLTSAQYSKFINNLVKYVLPRIATEETMLQPYVEKLNEFGFRKNKNLNSDTLVCKKIFSVDEVKNIIRELYDLAEKVWNEDYEILFDYLITELTKESNMKLKQREEKEEQRQMQADSYVVYTSFRNGFMDLDRKPTAVKNLNDIDPKNVSWFNICFTDEEGFAEDTKILEKNGIAYCSIIKNDDELFPNRIYIPIIKAIKVVGIERIRNAESYTYSINKGWIPVKEAKQLTDGVVHTPGRNRRSPWTWNELHSDLFEGEIISELI